MTDTISPSTTRGMSAGAVPTLVGAPMLPIAYTICAFSEKLLLAKVFHLQTTYMSMTAAQHDLGTFVVAATTGLLTSFLGSLAALKWLGRVSRTPFIATGIGGYALLAFGLWRWLAFKKPDWTTGFPCLLLFVLAAAGVALAYHVLEDEAGEAATGRRR